MADVAAGIIDAASLEGLQSGLTAKQQRLDVLKADINEALLELDGDPDGELGRLTKTQLRRRLIVRCLYRA